MTKGFHKKKSKRMQIKRRVKIEKKVREHNKKLRKEAKKKSKRPGKPKDPGVPNSLPFKAEVLQEAQRVKENEEERRKMLREEAKKRQKSKRNEKLDSSRNLATVAGFKEFSSSTSREEFVKEFKSVVTNADVIIEIIDARDPLGTRVREVEDAVLNAQKRLILLLNKSDLVPKDNLVTWLKYLRNELPCVAFKASTQSQKSHLGVSRAKITNPEQTHWGKKCVGVETLMSLLANYRRNKDIKTSITIGVVGLPNVGKSSVINSLKRSRACQVGALPGLTKNVQQVSLDRNTKLLDSPGVIFSRDANVSKAHLALRNAVNVDSLEDPVTPVTAILSRVSREQLMLHYNLPTFRNANEFLALLAKRVGKLKKGGIPHSNAAARRILHDWNNGKIKYYTEPPEKTETHLASEIVTEMSKEFCINDAFIDQQMQNIEESNEINTDELTSFKVTEPSEEMVETNETGKEIDDSDQFEDMETDEEVELNEKLLPKKTKVSFETKESHAKSEKITIEDKSDGDELRCLQLNKQIKKAWKKNKKQQKKKAKKDEELADSVAKSIDISGDNYDFDEHFN